jgi:beta-lactamase class A
MSFYYNGQVMRPAVSYPPQPQTGPVEHHLQWWHIVLVFLGLTMAMVGVFSRIVLGNLQANNELVTQSVVATPQVPEPVAPAVAAQTATNAGQSLQTDINNWVNAQKSTTWAVDVQALDGSLLAGTNTDRSFRLASIYKLFLLQPLAQRIPSSTWDTTKINTRTYKDCVDAMIRVSDNACAEAIGTKLGWAKVDQVLQALGYVKTNFSASGSSVSGTAHETTILLQNLHNHDGFDQITYDLVMAAMRAPKKSEGIRRGCPTCTVYNKIGEYAEVRHDAALVEKDGKMYSVVIFSEGGSWQQITDLTKVITSHF